MSLWKAVLLPLPFIDQQTQVKVEVCFLVSRQQLFENLLKTTLAYSHKCKTANRIIKIDSLKTSQFILIGTKALNWVMTLLSKWAKL